MVPLLRRLRPEMGVTCLDAAPTGLVVCTGLNPLNRVLSDAYETILAEWEPIELVHYGMARLHAEARPSSAAEWLNEIAPFSPPGCAVSSGHLVDPERFPRLYKINTIQQTFLNIDAR